MKVYFIVPSDEFLPSEEDMAQIKEVAETEVVTLNKGKLADISQLKADESDKIIAVDPDVFEWDLDAKALKDVPNVVAVCPSSTSFDWVKPDILNELDITITNVPGASSDSVAEYALAMSIELARHLPEVFQNSYKPLPAENLRNLKSKTAGIIGLGNIGTRMAELMQAVGMNVMYWSRSSTDDRFEKVELDDLFKTADLILPALAENEETEQLFTKKRLDLLKETAMWVGILRVRDLWDEEYLIGKVKDGTLGGYAFESDEAKTPDQYKGNIWAVPPIAWKTQDTLDNYMNIWAENILSVIAGDVKNKVKV